MGQIYSVLDSKNRGKTKKQMQLPPSTPFPLETFIVLPSQLDLQLSSYLEADLSYFFRIQFLLQIYYIIASCKIILFPELSKSILKLQLEQFHSFLPVLLGLYPALSFPINFLCLQQLNHPQTSDRLYSPQANPESILSTKSKQASLKSEQLAEASNDIQTPNFNGFHSQNGNENLFDSYHHHFSERNNQLEQLISTFSGLGLEIEYLQESEASGDENASEEPAGESSKVDQHRGGYPNDQELNLAAPMKSTVSKSSIFRLSPKQRQHLDSIKLNIKNTRTLLASFLHSIASFQKEYRSIFRTAHTYFTNFLSKHLLSYRSELEEERSLINSQGHFRYLEKDNDQLCKLLVAKEEKLKSLDRERQYLQSQNEKLHLEMQKLSKQHSKCQDLLEENEDIGKMLGKTETKNRELEIYVNEMTEKMDNLEWRLKESQKECHVMSYEGRALKGELQKKYQKMFNETIEELTHKIESETYYRLTHEYPIKTGYEEPESRGNSAQRYSGLQMTPSIANLRLVKQSSSHYGNLLQTSPTQCSFFQTFAPSSNLKLSLPANINGGRQSLSTVSICSQSFESSILSGSGFQAEERRADKLINDIRKMNSSNVRVPNYPSSRKIEGNYYGPRRPNQYRRKI